MLETSLKSHQAASEQYQSLSSIDLSLQHQSRTGADQSSNGSGTHAGKTAGITTIEKSSTPAPQW